MIGPSTFTVVVSAAVFLDGFCVYGDVTDDVWMAPPSGFGLSEEN